MREAMDWVQKVAGNGKPVLVEYPLSFDWSWLYWYFIRFCAESPFNYSRCFDIKTAFAVKAHLPIADAGRSRMEVTLDLTATTRTMPWMTRSSKPRSLPMSSNGRDEVGEALEKRRSNTAERIKDLKAKHEEAEQRCDDKACVFATGSFGRRGASQYSDLDVFIVGDGIVEKPALGPLDQILVKADLIEAVRAMKIQDFSGGGEYLKHYTVYELISSLGNSGRRCK